MNEDNFDPQVGSVRAIGVNLKSLRSASNGLRRMQADESFSSDGVRTVWHRARGPVELLSWEASPSQVIRQELTLYNYVIEFRAATGVSTGTFENSGQASGSMPTSKVVSMEREPTAQILDYGSYLLRHVADRDFYVQHLLQQINSAITLHGFDDARTQARVSRFSRSAPTLPADSYEKWQVERSSRQKRGIAIGVAIAAAAVGIAAALYALVL